jgi:hypothetical protein
MDSVPLSTRGIVTLISADLSMLPSIIRLLSPLFQGVLFLSPGVSDAFLLDDFTRLYVIFVRLRLRIDVLYSNLNQRDKHG